MIFSEKPTILERYIKSWFSFFAKNQLRMRNQQKIGFIKGVKDQRMW